MAILDDDAMTYGQGFRFSSDLRDDIWHADAETGAYEWWYFDAVSDDGREALVIIFLANFIFSPRYNRAASTAECLQTNSGGESPPSPQFPAVSFCLYRDGRPALRVVNEYAAVDFQASRERPECRIGASCFQLEESDIERRFRLTLDEPLRGGQRLRGIFTWEMIEGDYVRVNEASETGGAHSHEWNLVAPRCRVSGSYNVGGRKQKASGQRPFAGVGYHDHNRDRRWLPTTVASWQWGRAHFPDATVVFYRYREIVEQTDTIRIFLIRRDQLSQHPAIFTTGPARRHHFGLHFSRHIEIAFADQTQHLTLHVNQQQIVDASYFYLRFLGDATLTLGDNRGTQHAPAITEHLAPRALRWRWLDWLTDMRISRHGRASFLP